MWSLSSSPSQLHLLDEGHDGGKGGGRDGGRPAVVTHKPAVVHALGGKEQHGRAEGLLISGRGIAVTRRSSDGWNEDALHPAVAPKGGAEQQQCPEVVVRGGVVEPQVMEQAVGVQLLHVIAERSGGVAAKDAAAQDAEQVGLEDTNELRLEEVLHPAANLNVGHRAVVQLHHDLAVEQRDAQRQADAVRTVVYLKDGRLVVLEDAAPDEYRLIGREILTVGREREALALLDEEGQQRLHLLMTDPYRGARPRAVVVQVQPTLTVPLTARQLGNLVSRGLDEHEAVQAGARAVVVVRGLLRLQGLLLFLKPFPHTGLDHVQEGDDIEDGLLPPPEALRILELELPVDERGLKMGHDVPVPGGAGCCFVVV